MHSAVAVRQATMCNDREGAGEVQGGNEGMKEWMRGCAVGDSRR